MLRDEIDQMLFNKLVLTGIYLSVFVLFLIGILFKRIIEFSDKNHIIKLLQDEFINEVNNSYQIQIKQHYSKFLLRKLIDDNVVKMHSIFDELRYDSELELITDTEYENVQKSYREITDINLAKLERFIKNKERQ